MKNATGNVTPTSVRAAATIITMLPIVCIYPFLQKYFVTGLTLGGVKE
jgi:putative aldouronate transport system permease protein